MPCFPSRFFWRRMFSGPGFWPTRFATTFIWRTMFARFGIRVSRFARVDSYAGQLLVLLGPFREIMSFFLVPQLGHFMHFNRMVRHLRHMLAS